MNLLQRKKVKLIFNPNAGATRKVKFGLPEILQELNKRRIEPDVCMVGPECNLALELKTALSRGVRTFAVCGGDGTVSSVADILAGTDAAIAIIPAGTHNNDAKSLKIPPGIPEAVEIIRSGKRIRIDAGIARCGGVIAHFLEIVSVGLVAALTESGDDLQHGRIASIGEFLSTFVACPPAEISLTLDNGRKISDTGYVALATNMPYAGSHYQFGHARCHRDGLLDVLFFSDLSKLDLLKYISQGIYIGKHEDSRIQHYTARTIDMETRPPMPVTADGRVIGEGGVHIELRRDALGFIVGKEYEA